MDNPFTKGTSEVVSGYSGNSNPNRGNNKKQNNNKNKKVAAVVELDTKSN